MSYCLYKNLTDCNYFENNNCTEDNKLCKKTKITFAF